MLSATKDPLFVESGRRGAEKRWSDPSKRSAVNIADLTIEQRSLVLALVAAAREEASVPEKKTDASEVSDAVQRTPNASTR